VIYSQGTSFVSDSDVQIYSHVIGISINPITGKKGYSRADKPTPPSADGADGDAVVFDRNPLNIIVGGIGELYSNSGDNDYRSKGAVLFDCDSQPLFTIYEYEIDAIIKHQEKK
jgi:hypothetical protein